MSEIVSVYIKGHDGVWCERLSVVTSGASTPWSWASLPGLWHSWDHGDDWATFLATDGRMRVRVSPTRDGTPWLTSECREKGR